MNDEGKEVVVLMVMVPLFEHDEILESPWPKPTLRVIEGGRAPSAQIREIDRVVIQERPARHAAPRPSPATFRRRRIAVGVLAAAIGFVAISGLSSVINPAPQAPGAASSIPGLAMKGYYTVQEGDTLQSVAAAVAGGADVQAVKAAIVQEVGSSVVVPGERIAIP